MNLYGLQQLVESASTVRKNTILIAEDIPEKDYGYRPTRESRSVAETLVHIALLSQAARLLHKEASLENFNFGELVRKLEIEEQRPRSKNEKAELTEQVRMPGGALKIRFEVLLGTKEHEMHHRAQLTVIERLLGIVPHLTRNRQLTAAAAAKVNA